MKELNKMYKKQHENVESIKENIIKLTERWKKIDGFPNYSVSDMGRVRNDTTGRFLKDQVDKYGYYNIDLNHNGNRKTHKIHRLIAYAFIKNPQNKPFVDHIDCNPKNNNLNNLRWATLEENNRNSSISKRNRSGIKGVCFKNQFQKWNAHITINGKHYHLGYFIKKEDAIGNLEEVKDAFFVVV